MIKKQVFYSLASRFMAFNNLKSEWFYMVGAESSLHFFSSTLSSKLCAILCRSYLANLHSMEENGQKLRGRFNAILVMYIYFLIALE